MAAKKTDTPTADATPDDSIPTKASVTSHRLGAGKKGLAYDAAADWMVLKVKNKPLAKMFHVAYLAKNSGPAKSRPVTFVFNGGPGASSAYLHMAAVGPRRIVFNGGGNVPQPPVQLVDNTESWLGFTDLVFVDPVGTGFSRSYDRRKPKDDKEPASAAPADPKDDKENPEFWEVERDIDSLGQFIQLFLSKNDRWTSPVFIAGESYGGFRVARLAKKLQQGYGVGLNGAILISPAIEFASLFGNDYSINHWYQTFPVMAAVAHTHGRCAAVSPKAPLADVIQRAEGFAVDGLLQWLALGDELAPEARRELSEEMSSLIGLPADLLLRAGGRVNIREFGRNLLRDETRLVGLYDGSVTCADPYPDRDAYEGPDPTLMSIDRLFTAGVNQHLRSALKVDTDMDYRLLSYDVNSEWKFNGKNTPWAQLTGSMDDLRYGMSLNPHMRVVISHGYYDLVTPYYASNRLVNHMKLSAGLRDNLTVKHYKGGHMFYSWDDSRKSFHADMKALYKTATAR